MVEIEEAKQNSKQDQVCHENWNTYGSSHFSFNLLDHCWNVVFWIFELRNLFTDEVQEIQSIQLSTLIVLENLKEQ